jgi:uridine phosphorylase
MESVNLIIVVAITAPCLIIAKVYISKYLAKQKARQEKEILINKLEAAAFEYASKFVDDDTVSEDEFYQHSVILSKKFDAIKALRSENGA